MYFCIFMFSVAYNLYLLSDIFYIKFFGLLVVDYTVMILDKLGMGVQQLISDNQLTET
jgi:hypothetical protein